MKDQSLDRSVADAPAPIEHLDLVTAELRRRIAGIGLAIAELREETGRLRASADDRYPATAVLDCPSHGGGVGADDAHVAVVPRPLVVEPDTESTEATVVVGDAPRGAGPAEPVSPWGPAPDVAAGPSLTWVPAPDPVAVAAPAVAVPPPAVAGVAGHGVAAPAAGTCAAEPTPAVQMVAAEEAPSLWGDSDDDDAAAFEAFFSTEIEPEPSQRWLLSD